MSCELIYAHTYIIYIHVYCNSGQLQDGSTTLQRDADQQAVGTTPQAGIIGTTLQIQLTPILLTRSQAT